MSGRRMMAAAALAGLMTAGLTGCVPKGQYDEAVAASRRANAELIKCQSALQQAHAENESLNASLAGRDRDLAAKNEYIATLTAANDDLTGKFNDLRELYRKLANREPPPVGKIRILPMRVDAALRALAKDNPELMEYLPEYGMVKLKADLTFAKGSADVRSDAVPALRKLVEVLNSQDAATFNVYVAGHTDDIPLRKPETVSKHGSNWGLSVHRALAVIKVLAEAGLQQNRAGAMGFSKYHPIAPNAPGEKGNPANRRVEIWIVPPDRFLTVSGPAAGS